MKKTSTFLVLPKTFACLPYIQRKRHSTNDDFITFSSLLNDASPIKVALHQILLSYCRKKLINAMHVLPENKRGCYIREFNYSSFVSFQRALLYFLPFVTFRAMEIYKSK